ncbi:NADH-quinone oxidoreductase subunit NuoK [Reichenbachiella versicolor]|uniref:NADH-quinone oxidoreductase subunit NuoK n=1 Tax=Reichenbachiella versicolor TaxID=1821036 RepID=UPI000D6E4922|nr:NADH-quinone oxidoreductase subunit NuoK [Reichenbachiella versicolor]
MIPIEHYLVFSTILLVIGLLIIIVKRNAIMVLAGVELILNSANINFIGFSKYDPSLTGQMASLFILVVAVAESAVALAIIYQIFKNQGVSNVDELTELNG